VVMGKARSYDRFTCADWCLRVSDGCSVEDVDSQLESSCCVLIVFSASRVMVA
jgi:hypothetical protein